MNPLFLAVSRWSAFLFLRSGLARFWYKLYQFIWERNKRTPIRRFTTLPDMVKYMRDMKWRADTWRELGDAISSPEAVQYRADNNPEHFIGDCDEFGIYQAAIINNELADDPNWSNLGILNAKLLSVMWYKTGDHKGFGGHNVCLIAYTDGTYSYMDYGWPQARRETVQEIANDVRLRYATPCQSLGCAVSDPRSLKVLQAQRT